jgi:hypothetical protein
VYNPFEASGLEMAQARAMKAGHRIETIHVSSFLPKLKPVMARAMKAGHRIETAIVTGVRRDVLRRAR